MWNTDSTKAITSTSNHWTCKKKHDPYDPGNPDTSLGQALKCGGIKPS